MYKSCNLECTQDDNRTDSPEGETGGGQVKEYMTITLLSADLAEDRDRQEMYICLVCFHRLRMITIHCIYVSSRLLYTSCLGEYLHKFDYTIPTI